MPELPEVETTLRGIAPYLANRRITQLVLRRPDLRWPIPPELASRLPGQRIETLERRAKYLLLHTQQGSALLHLGMSGVLRVVPAQTPPGKHDHVDIELDADAQRPAQALRFTDPRRFGCLLWQEHGTVHPLLTKLGPEPLGPDFDGDMLWRASRGRRCAVKLLLMDPSVVVGVGNIYANETLFAAGIDPRRRANSISRAHYQRLATAVQQILGYAIERGGTTLRDFLSPDGAPGYFFRELMVYGRAAAPCKSCGTPIHSFTLGQRASYRCPRCQR